MKRSKVTTRNGLVMLLGITLALIVTLGLILSPASWPRALPVSYQNRILTLEISRKAHGDTTRWSDSVTGEKTTEVDHVENII
jgi:hypothetical protein